jgi:hypothetical protein
MSTLTYPENQTFYRLDDPLGNRAMRLTVRGFSDWVSTEYAFKLFYGKILPEQVIRFGVYMGGSQTTDFLWSDLSPLFCISERIVTCFKENGITGWQTYPVEVFGRKGEALPGYHGFSIVGAECRRDRSRSKIVTRQAVPGGMPFEVYQGLFFHQEDWDGSDIFTISGFGGKVMTEKVCHILKKIKATNLGLIPLAEVEIDVNDDKFDHDL